MVAPFRVFAAVYSVPDGAIWQLCPKPFHTCVCYVRPDHPYPPEIPRLVQLHQSGVCDAQEVEIAKQVQARLFPQVRPQAKTLEYAGLCLQARQVGGDG